MSTEIQKWTEPAITELLKPKQADLVRMIGEDRLKKEISFALQAIAGSEQLKKCEPKSVCKAIFNLALTGLSLNPISKLAYLTARYVSGKLEAILMPSYMGLVKLISDTGSVKTVYAYPVYEYDEFEVTLGTEVGLKHAPKFLSKNIKMVYAVAILPDGTKLVEVMSATDVHEIRGRSDGFRAYEEGKIKSNPWVTDEGEMFRKTVIKRITKYVPKTDKWDKVNEAIDLDNQEYPATYAQQDLIENLLVTSVYDEDTRDIIRTKLEDGITNAEASNIIQDLQSNQLDPVKAGLNYGATDAKKAVENVLFDDKK